MSDTDQNYLGTKDDPQLRLKADVLILQLKGAGYALIFCLICWAAIAATGAIGALLPEESKEADDPSPWSYVLPIKDKTRA